MGVGNWRGGGGKCVEKRKKILNSGNEPKKLLKTKLLAFLGARNELVFECKRTQIKPQKEAKKPPFVWPRSQNSRVERRRQVGEYQGGYTSIEFDLSRHQKPEGARVRYAGQKLPIGCATVQGKNAPGRDQNSSFKASWISRGSRTLDT
jgi:hypothetical protein